MDMDSGAALLPLTVQFQGIGWPLWRRPEIGELLAKDLDVAGWVEFGRPRDIRKLIERYSADLGPVFRPPADTRPTMGRESDDSRDTMARESKVARRSRGGQEWPYYLTEEQALFIAAKSETPKATLILKTIIAVFMRARRGEPPSSALAVEVERQIERQMKFAAEMEAKFTNLHALVMTLPLGGCLPAVRPPPPALLQSEVLRPYPGMKRYGLRELTKLGKGHGELYSLIRALQIVLPDNTRGPCLWPIERIYEGWPDRFGYKPQRARRLLDELLRSGWILRLADGGLLPQAKAMPIEEQALSVPTPPSTPFVDNDSIRLLVELAFPGYLYGCAVALVEVPIGEPAFEVKRSQGSPPFEQTVNPAHDGHAPRTILAFDDRWPFAQVHRCLPRKAGIRWVLAWTVRMNGCENLLAEVHAPSGDSVLVRWSRVCGGRPTVPPVRFHDGHDWPIPPEPLQILERRRMFKGTLQQWAEEEVAAETATHAATESAAAPPVAAAPPSTPATATSAAKEKTVSPTLEAVISALTNLGHKPKAAKAAAKAAFTTNEGAAIEVVLQAALALLRPH